MRSFDSLGNEFFAWYMSNACLTLSPMINRLGKGTHSIFPLVV